jgi:hypothetical protein
MIRRTFVKALGKLIALGGLATKFPIHSMAADAPSDTVKFWAPVARADVLNSNGNIYPKHSLDKEVKEFETKFKAKLLGQIGYPRGNTHPNQWREPVSYRDVSHVVTNLKMDQGYLLAEIEILDTPQGNVLKSMDVCYRTYGIMRFKIQPEGLILCPQHSFELLGIHALPIEDAAIL